MKIKIYRVGGSVRDSFLGFESKDIDYAVEASYDDMKSYILERGDIFLEKPEFGTIRCRVNGEVADYSICRVDGNYSDGRRPDSIKPASIYDDLSRRDFTMNAIAIDEDGNILDPYNGRNHIDNRIIVCVNNTYDRMREDALRMLRALRFSITKQMWLDTEIVEFLCWSDNINLLRNVSTERIREELYKMFSCDTYQTLKVMKSYPYLESFIFEETPIWLKPTMENK